MIFKVFKSGVYLKKKKKAGRKKWGTKEEGKKKKRRRGLNFDEKKMNDF